jgi:hypothetical protein
MKSELKGRNIWVMHYETTQWDKYSLHPSFNSFSFHTDTHYTQPPLQWNRSSRGATSEWCITKQYSETNTLFIHHSTLSHFIQTLTTLDLSRNHIEAQGAQHLSDALRNNTVRQILSSSIIQLFLISYRHSLHSTSLVITSKLKGRNIWVMHYEKTKSAKYSLHPSFNSFSFHTDTHETRPHRQSNRR